MSAYPDAQESPLKRRDPAAPLSPAHKALITILAEHLAEQYLAEEDETWSLRSPRDNSPSKSA